MKGRFMLLVVLFIFAFVPMVQAKDTKLCCQGITFRFGGGEEIEFVDATDLDVVPADEIYKAITYLGAIRGSEGNKELKMEIFKRIAPNLYKRHFESREKDLCR
jgi:hypothetical protein